jgi:hypothetical protein
MNVNHLNRGETNQIIHADDNVKTEADVEQKVVLPLLTGANFLEVPPGSIKAKEYLQPGQLDKAAGKTTGYYPDFSVWEKALPILIVEAKAPEVAPEVGYREASLYARHLNQQYKTGLNPCRFLIACNGRRLLAGYWDSEPSLDMEVKDLCAGSNAVGRVRDLCHHRLIASYAYQSLIKIRERHSIRPYSKVGGQALISSKKPFNTFAAELSPVLRRYFTSTSQSVEREIYEKGYVGSDDVTTYDRILESLLRDRISTRRGSLTQELSPTETWLCERFIASFQHENPDFDPYASENLTRIFSRDLQRRKGIYDQLRKVSQGDAERARISDLQEWQDDPQRLAFGICRHFSSEKLEVVVAVMDNVDRLDLDNQLAAFQLSLWFLSQSQAFVLLQMRDETYERFKDRPPLDTFRSGVTFHISPPRFLDVVKRRLELSLDYLTNHTEDRLEYTLGSGARISYPNSMLGAVP